jgi:hypothetical protein
MNINIKDVIQGYYIEPKIAQLLNDLNSQNIIVFQSGEFYINSANFAAHEIVINVNEKIIYLIRGFDCFNLEGASKLFRFYRRLLGASRIIQSHSIANSAHVLDTSKINPFICNSLSVVAGIANVDTTIIINYFKITVQ